MHGKAFINGQIYGGFGALTTSGTLDWNDSTNARSGNGHTLLRGNATNGPAGAEYYHPFSWEYSSYDNDGNMTQFAIPYSTNNTGMYYRSRYNGTWTGWAEIVTTTKTLPGGPYLPLAGGTMSGNTNHSDNVKDRYGTGNDFQIWHDGSNTFLSNEGEGHLNIINTGDDRDIVFKTDDGSGATTSYMVIDGSAEQTRFYKDTRHTDNVVANFGNSDDLQIYHDGSNSYINQVGVGKLVLQSASGINIQATSGETRFTQSGVNSEIKIDDASQANKVVLKASGNSYFNGGNVGIGTTSPSGKLQVDGGKLVVDHVIGGITIDTVQEWNAYSGVSGNTKLDLKIGRGASNKVSIFQATYEGGGYSDIILQDQGGNVGIGTTSPGAKLEVNGVIRVEGGTYVASADTVTDAGIVITEDDYIYTKDSGNLRKLIGKGGDVISIGQSGTSLIDGISFLSGLTPFI